MTQNEQLLRQAIAAKSPVKAKYQGYPREMCPHILGHKDGRLQVLVYQYAGQSSSRPIVTPTDPSNGPAANWRCIVVEELVDLEVLPPGPWYTCQRHSQPSTCVDTIVAEVPRV
jgi:hypothetical protein